MAVLIGAGGIQTGASGAAFKGSGGGQITGQDVIGPTEVLLSTEGTGTATHLGRFRRVESLRLNPATGAFTGAITFTAANGDELACVVRGQFISITDAVGDYVFTGGTGRFQHASGQATFSASMTGATSFTVEFGGELDWYVWREGHVRGRV